MTQTLNKIKLYPYIKTSSHPPVQGSSVGYKSGKPCPPPPFIKTVAIVGAVFVTRSELRFNDFATLQESVAILKGAGFAFAPETKYHFYNLLPPLNNDFLQAALDKPAQNKADAVIVCGVPSHGITYDTPNKYFPRPHAYAFRGSERPPENLISPLHEIEGVWAIAADAIGAKIIITRGPKHPRAIESADFNFSPYYYEVIPTYTPDPADPRPLLGSSATGLMAGHLGILVHEKALDGLRYQANVNTPLGREILCFDNT